MTGHADITTLRQLRAAVAAAHAEATEVERAAMRNADRLMVLLHALSELVAYEDQVLAEARACDPLDENGDVQDDWCHPAGR